MDEFRKSASSDAKAKAQREEIKNTFVKFALCHNYLLFFYCTVASSLDFCGFQFWLSPPYHPWYCRAVLLSGPDLRLFYL